MIKLLRKTALWIILAPLALEYAGAGLNQLVLIKNNDTFPVEVNTFKEKIMAAKETAEWKDMAEELGIDSTLPEGYIDSVHVVMTSKTHLNWLADIFDMHDGIYSVGDGLIILGEWLLSYAPFIWLFEAVRRLRS